MSKIRIIFSFSILLLIASILSACADGGSTGFDEGLKNSKAVGDQRLCVTFANYDGLVDPNHLKATLSVSQQDVAKAAVEGRVDIGNHKIASDEEPVPAPSDEEESVQQDEEEQSKPDYEEELIPEESMDLQAEEISLDLSQSSDDSCSDEEESEAETDKIESEDAEAQKLAEQEAEAIHEDEYEEKGEEESESVEDSIDSVADSAAEQILEIGLVAGDVTNSEATLDEDKTLRFYFDIASDLYPIDVESLSVYDTSKGDDKVILYVPLNTAAQNSRASFQLNWEDELAAQSKLQTEVKEEPADSIVKQHNI